FNLRHARQIYIFASGKPPCHDNSSSDVAARTPKLLFAGYQSLNVCGVPFFLFYLALSSPARIPAAMPPIAAHSAMVAHILLELEEVTETPALDSLGSSLKVSR